ncbi:MAG: TssQ family T6SS-associated lipoprotein [Burkholderiaceae bacterium]|jgi:Tfp pilus assembly protein PilF|nr:TssQ family T6SS-associated lipoprotein [Burkholderiaceae bacterium]
MRPLPRHRLSLLVLAAAALAAGCAAPPPPPAPTPGLAEVMERPAERALLDGIRAYDDAQYAQAETALRQALAIGLKSARDRATAHKLLAFITCTSDRLADCQAQFREARAADAAFALSRSEAGHPVWGPVYKSLPP